VMVPIIGKEGVDGLRAKACGGCCAHNWGPVYFRRRSLVPRWSAVHAVG
jgi:hypothetical protein